METPTHIQRSPRLPAAVLVALALFSGCGPQPYRDDINAYVASDRLIVPADYERPTAVFVRPLGIRRPRTDGDLRVDVLIAGDRAFEAASQWLSAATRGGGSANAILSLRRTSPDATPLSLAFTGDRATARPLDAEGRELDRGLNASDRRIMLTFILDASPAYSTGLYDVSLLVPAGANASPWDVGPLDIALETTPLRVQVADTTRIQY